MDKGLKPLVASSASPQSPHERKAFPQDGGAGFAVVLAAQEAAQLGNPADRLLQRGRGGWGQGDLMDGAIQRLPFVRLEQGGTVRLGQSAAEPNGIQDAPSDDTEQAQTAPQPLGGFQLTLLQATTTLEDFVPDFIPLS